jgi:hypothetical protein
MMKFFLSALLAFVVFSGSSSAQNAGSTKASMTGYLTDVKCGSGFKTDADAQAHTRACALMPACAKSGYALFIDGKLIKLDVAGNKKAKAYLKTLKDEKNLKVEIQGEMKGDVLTVAQIKTAM